MNKPDQKSLSSEQDDSVSRSPEFRVDASPLNTVKFDLGVLLILGIFLWLLVGKISDSATVQLMILAGYGLASMLWVIFHARRIMHRVTNTSNSGTDSDN